MVGGQLYLKDKEVDTKIYWRCEHYQKVKCVEFVISENNRIVTSNAVHNHVADAARVEGHKVMNNIQENAKHIQDAPQLIIPNASIGLSQATTNLAKVCSIKRTIRNVRNKH